MVSLPFTWNIVIIIIIVCVLYKYLTRNFKYWQKLNVPYIKPLPIFGNLIDVLTLQRTLGESLSIYYKKFNFPYFGLYMLNQPLLVIKDINLIKHILLKDFNFFADRYALSDEKIDPLAAHMLFFSKTPEWKYMRKRTTTVFSSGKLKKIDYLITEVANDMISYLNNHCINETVEAKDFCCKYATDVITSYAFGLYAHSFKNSKSGFRIAAEQMFDFNLKRGFQQMAYFISHDMVRRFKFQFFDVDIAKMLRNVFWETIKEREKLQVTRHDIIDVVKNFKNVILENGFEFEGDKILAQAAQFFIAGFEAISSTISFALYELSFQPDIQKRLRDEICKHSVTNYETVNSLEYLNMVISETLRKYPVLPFIDRLCLQDYKLPNTNFTVKKGTPVYIATLGLHHDENYYRDPHKFDPERFSTSNRKNLFPCTYLPFGAGPRTCIGERFGLLVTKIGLSEILRHFEVAPSPNTPRTIRFSAKTFFLASNDGIPLVLKKLLQ